MAVLASLELGEEWPHGGQAGPDVGAGRCLPAKWLHQDFVLLGMQ